MPSTHFTQKCSVFKVHANVYIICVHENKLAASWYNINASTIIFSYKCFIFMSNEIERERERGGGGHRERERERGRERGGRERECAYVCVCVCEREREREREREGGMEGEREGWGGVGREQ